MEPLVERKISIEGGFVSTSGEPEEEMSESYCKRAELLVRSLAVSLCLLEGFTGTNAVEEIITILRDKDFDSKLFAERVVSMKSCHGITSKILQDQERN